MQARRRTRSRIFILPFVGLTLLLHLSFIMAGSVYYLLHPPKPWLENDDDSVDVSFVDADDEAVRQLARELAEKDPALAQQLADEEKEKEKQRLAEEESIRAPGQVVDLPRPAEEKTPKDAKFVSEYNTSAEREMKSRAEGKPGAAPGPKQPPAAASPPPAPEPQEQKAAKGESEKAPGPLAMKSRTERPSPPGLPGAPGQEPAPDRAPEGATERAPDGIAPERSGVPQPGGEGSPTQEERKLSMQELLPSDRQLQRSVAGGGGGGTIDYLKDIDEGEATALNSKKWKFASFFNRVKRVVAEHWRPDIEYRRRDPSGNVYGLKTRRTVLRVSLKPDGTLMNVEVEHPCGVDFLDDEAIEAFKQAQPFPNPPRQLVDESGNIQFRFAFIFEINTQPVMKVFRYN